MDWQDVLSLVIFILLATFSKKRKPAEADETSSEEEVGPSEIETVRKKIEALKRQRNSRLPEPVASAEAPEKKRPTFSAYKHLPKEEVIPKVPIPKVVPDIPLEKTPKEPPKSIDVPRRRSRLRDWVMGQVILNAPAYKRYGNFIHR